MPDKAGLHRIWSQADKPACIDCRRAIVARAASSSRRHSGATRSGSHAAARGAGLQYLAPNPAPMHRSIRERVVLQCQAAGRFHALQAPAAYHVHLPRPRYHSGQRAKSIWPCCGPPLDLDLAGPGVERMVLVADAVLRPVSPAPTPLVPVSAAVSASAVGSGRVGECFRASRHWPDHTRT